MKKILFINSILWPGGIEKTLINITNELSNNNNYDITILTIYEDKSYNKYINENIKYRYIFKDINLKSISKKIYDKIKYELLMNASWLLNKIFIGKRYDIVIGFAEGFPTKLASYSKKSRKIAWIHTDFKEFRWSYNHYKNIEYERRAYELMDNIICVSNISKENFLNIYNFREKTKLIYNFIDNKNILEMSNHEILDFEFQDGIKYFIYIGRFSKVKRVDRLIEAFRLLVNEFDNVKLILIGDGSLKSKLINQVKQLNLEKVVYFLGLKNNPYKYLKKSSVLICSSDSECAPVTINESIILEVPIITTDCSGAVEMINYGEYGLIVNKESYSLFEGMKALLNNNKQYCNYKLNMHKNNQGDFYRQSIKKIEELFKV